MFPKAWRRLWKRLESPTKPLAPSHKPTLELLENRLVPATFRTGPDIITVLSTADTTPGLTTGVTRTANVNATTQTYTVQSLRQGIELAQGLIPAPAAQGAGATTTLGTPGTVYLDGADTIQLKTDTYFLYNRELRVTFSATMGPDVGNLTIQNSHGGMSVIDGDSETRVFAVDADENPGNSAVTFNFLRIQNGVVGGEGSDFGAGILNRGTLTLNTCEVHGNRVTDIGEQFFNTAQGGGIYNGSQYDVNETVAGSIRHATLTLNNSQISGNAVYGGSLPTSNQQIAPEGSPGSDGGNAEGGGLYIAVGSGKVTISRTTFSNNIAMGGNGTTSSSPTVTTTVRPDVGNSSSSSSSSSSTPVTGTHIGGAGVGGGLYLDSSYGGSLGGLSIVNSTFGQNEALGGSVNPVGPNPGVGFGGNAFGGGIFLGRSASSQIFVNDTIAHNDAEGGAGYGGGGGSAYGGGVFGNGGAINNAGIVQPHTVSSFATFQNSIIALNTLSSQGMGPDVFGFFSSKGNNLLSDPQAAIYGFTAKGDQVGANPGFTSTILTGGGPVRNGPSATTNFQLQVYFISATSRARNKGNNVVISPVGSTDQIGNPRIAGGIIDIGAIEFVEGGLGKWGSKFYNP